MEERRSDHLCCWRWEVGNVLTGRDLTALQDEVSNYVISPVCAFFHTKAFYPGSSSRGRRGDNQPTQPCGGSHANSANNQRRPHIADGGASEQSEASDASDASDDDLSGIESIVPGRKVDKAALCAYVTACVDSGAKVIAEGHPTDKTREGYRVIATRILKGAEIKLIQSDTASWEAERRGDAFRLSPYSYKDSISWRRRLSDYTLFEALLE
jgi:hypothetical protein